MHQKGNLSFLNKAAGLLWVSRKEKVLQILKTQKTVILGTCKYLGIAVKGTAF